jgi:imidazole glycerol-phosphate synthase subunit HisH
MSDKAVIVDYGRGNLLSVIRALEHNGCDVTVSDRASAVRQAERLVLPGVGAFGDAMAGLRHGGLAEAIAEFSATGRPFLGICLGMQLMFDIGEEFGEHPGLGLIPGRVKAIPRSGSDGTPHKIPHIGWNALWPAGGRTWRGTVMGEVEEAAEVYFVHSFTAWPANEADRLADSFYDGCRIAAAVQRGALCGCQFHPEKSGRVGLGVIRSFLAL